MICSKELGLKEKLKSKKFGSLAFGKKGGIAIETLIILVTVMFTSAGVFYLVSSGIVAVEGSNGAGYGSEQFLNTEFLPIAKGGTLALQDFTLCYERDIGDYSCKQDRSLFFLGDEVHFTYGIVSSSYMGLIELTENYRLIGPDGEIILDVAAENDIEYEAKADEEVELVYFQDYFVIGDEEEAGEYTLELIITNPLISKEAVLRKEITIME